MIARAPSRRRADTSGKPVTGGDATAESSATQPCALDEVERLRAELESIARETLRLLVEGPPDADRRVAGLDARAEPLRAAIRAASLAREDRDADWLSADERMAERALAENGRRAAPGG